MALSIYAIMLIIVTTLPAAADLGFIAVGDFGRDNSGQFAVSSGMNTVAGLMNASFAVLLGDNFYSHGIDSEADACSSRFTTTFQEVYDGLARPTI